MGGVVVVSFLAFLTWSRYLSPDARATRAQQEAVREIMRNQDNYEAAMRADTYGGKTPEETLKMFADAVASGNNDLAVKFLEFDYSGKPKKELEDGFKKAIQDGKKELMLEVINKAEFDPQASDENYAWFDVVGKDGMAEYSICLSLNRYAYIWKVKSM